MEGDENKVRRSAAEMGNAKHWDAVLNALSGFINPPLSTRLREAQALDEAGLLSQSIQLRPGKPSSCFTAAFVLAVWSGDEFRSRSAGDKTGSQCETGTRSLTKRPQRCGDGIPPRREPEGIRAILRHPFVYQKHLTPVRESIMNHTRSYMKNTLEARISSSKDLGVILARARKERGLSQREVATQLGVTQKWISAIEQGKSRAWIDKVLELSYFLGVQIHATTASARSSTSSSNSPGIDDLLNNEG